VMKRIDRRHFLLLSGGVLLAAACGSDDDSGPTAATGGGSATSTGSSGAGPASGGRSFEITNVSYDPTRELYAEYAGLFSAYYKEKTGNTVTVNNSHGGSGSQARAIVDGLEADVATLALAGDTNRVVEAGLIEDGWEAEFPGNSSPYTSTIVLLVRKGNPKGLADWPDLANDGLGVITPNPKTSGGARWNYLAAWGSVVKNGGTEEQAKELLGKIYENVLVLDSGARGSTQTFVERGIGDVLIAWENEALLSIQGSDDFEIVYPRQSILAEPAVAIVDSVVDKRGTREVATEFLNYLYDPSIQEIIAKHYYRPTNQDVLASVAERYPPFEREFITIRDFDGWAAVQEKFFNDGGIFDEIYSG
jgi:sulfate/thiosulfate transport system substrate-binding protein